MKEVTLQATSAPDKAKPVNGIERYSNYMLLLRLATWLFCVVTLYSSTPFQVAELSWAKTWLFKQAQAKVFPEAMEALWKGKPLPLSNSLQLMNPIPDADVLLGVNGHLRSPSHWKTITLAIHCSSMETPPCITDSTSLSCCEITWDGKRMRQLSASLRHLGRSTFLI